MAQSGEDGATGRADALEDGLGFYALVFTDIVSSTEQRRRLGDARADALHGEVDVLTRRTFARFHGVVVKGLGDGILAVFRAPSEAVEATVELQHRLRRRNVAAEIPVEIRVGVTVGEIDVTGGDVLGYPVNEASRLCDAAGANGILVSELALALARRTEVVTGEPVAVTVTASAEPAMARPLLLGLSMRALVGLPEALARADRSAEFVGRGEELARLRAAWAHSLAGRGRVGVVTGEPGAGKTTLLARLAIEASDQGAIVLYGRCDERVASPYEPFAEALSHFVDHCPAEELTELLGPVAGELGRMLPGLARRLGAAVDAPLVDPESARWRLLEAARTGLEALSRRDPVLLVLDDLHWADSASLDLLDRVMRETPAARLMIVLALRPWDPGANPEVARVLADRHRYDVDDTEVALGGLAREEVSDLVARMTQRHDLDRARVEELWSITGGHPLFVTQVLRARQGDEVIPTQMPRGLTEVLERQLARLGPLTRAALDVAALAGQRFEIALVAEVLGTGRADAVEALDEATRAGIVRALSGVPLRYEFTHALVRDVLEGELGEARRRSLHAELAGGIAVLGALGDDERARRQAYHWSEAGEFGDPARGVRAATVAVAASLHSLSLAEAFEMLERAQRLARLSPDPALDAELAVLRAEATSLAASPEAPHAQAAAVAAARALRDPTLLSRAALAHSRGYFTAWGRRDAGRVEALEAALASCPEGDRATRALLLARLANELSFGDVERRRYGLADDALTLARASGDASVLARVLVHRQYVLGGPEHLGLRVAEGTELERLARESGDRLLELHAARLLSAANTERADAAELDRCVERVAQLNDEVDLASVRWELASVRASRALLAGQLDDAARLVKQAYKLGAAAGQLDAYIFSGSQLMYLNYLRGRLPEVMDGFLAALPAEVADYLGPWVIRQLFLAGRVEEARDRWAATSSTALEDQLDVGVNAGLVLVSWAHMAWALGARPEELAVVRARLEPLAGQLFQQLAPEPPGHHFLGLLCDAAGEDGPCDEHFAAAGELTRRAGAPTLESLTAVAWARILARRGEGEAARRLAGGALELARACGAHQIESDARAVLEEER
ncbi:MAG TPA: AAA family ATPase [Acidimicrobiales bacterium]|nr:AAA family ATPase [Acidimicrobiales bacterium]